MTVFYGHHVACLITDSGATGYMIRLSAAKMLGVDVIKSSQYAHQADGLSPLSVVGETHFTVVWDNNDFLFEELVLEDLYVDILAGIPFMEQNDVTVRPAKHQIILGDGTTYLHGPSNSASHHTVCRAHVLHAPGTSSTIWPGDYIKVELPQDLSTIDNDFAVEPRTNTFVLPNSTMWPMVDPLSYFSFQPVLHDWCNKGRGMYYPVCGMVHIKEA